MAHFAQLDENNVVTAVIKGRDEGDLGIDWEQYYGSKRGLVCLRTSYNTYGNTHSQGKEPFRKNYAGIGYYYDAEKDAFIPPKPFNSWTLDETTCLWEPPVPAPEMYYNADEDKYYEYVWNESSQQWDLFEG